MYDFLGKLNQSRRITVMYCLEPGNSKHAYMSMTFQFEPNAYPKSLYISPVVKSSFVKDIKVGVKKMTRNRRKMIEQTGDSLLLSKHSIQLSALFLLLSGAVF